MGAETRNLDGCWTPARLGGGTYSPGAGGGTPGFKGSGGGGGEAQRPWAQEWLRMAARRLIAILIVLMLVSTFAATLAPQRQERSTSTESTTTATATSTPRSGELVEAVIPARPRKPRVIGAKPGDQISLLVRVARPQPVTIAALGLTEFATPGDPARFDILVRERRLAAIEVGEGGNRTTVGRIDAD